VNRTRRRDFLGLWILVAGAALFAGTAAVVNALHSDAPSLKSPPRAPYSSTSPFNQLIPPDPAIDPNSADMVEGLTQAAERHGVVVAVKRFSVPIFHADASTPRYNVRLTASWRAADYLLDVPIPDDARPAAGDDEHMIIIDTTTGCEYDLYDADRLETTWEADWANALPLSSRGVYEKGLSARGSGFGLFAGLIRPRELRNPDGSAGRIPHALVFNTPYVKAGGPVLPATESDGSSGLSYSIPQGARVQLDPNFDLSTLSKPYERVIARALQEYGAYVSDTSGSTIDFYAEDPKGHDVNPYAAIWGDRTYVSLPTSLIDNLRVLALPPQYEPEYEIVPNGCNRFRGGGASLTLGWSGNRGAAG
jgi:hypothetical protein